LWPGNFTSKIRRSSDVPESRDAWSAAELLRQIEVTRATPGATGNVHFSMKALMQNYDGIADKLKSGLYAEPALVPESPWLGRETPAKPDVAARSTAGGVAIQWKPGDKLPWQWLVRVQTDKGWKNAIVPGEVDRHAVRLVDGEQASTILVSAVTRLGQVGRPARAPINQRE
jgi:hypothetical protein